jgi:ribosomal protein S18 acetylase RimI-like enzyme
MSHDELDVVKLGPRDWRDLKTFRLEALRTEPAAFSSTYEETVLRPDEHWRERLASTQSGTWMVRREDRPIGMVGVHLGSDEGDPSVAVVVSMYVSQDHRRRGIGRALLRTLIDHIAASPEIRTIRLWVTATQVPARRLYESLGFRVVGVDEGEWVMERPIGLEQAPTRRNAAAAAEPESF